ncbi:PAP2-domain-containing protein [Pleurotus eryngii]|uniref:PAP2-domain-containing protein n=1 Tax=Pleurotus eryngii TaxID=5323 RepID=A0A9P6DKB6_PLEER|nr:PAP2-domain-containing protein [Pleurotus eryngii]
MKLSRTIRHLLSYGLDWVLGIALAIFFNFYLDKFQHFNRFDINDTDIQYPFEGSEVVPTILLGVVILSGYVIMGIGNLAFLRSWWDLHHSMLGASVALFFTGSITQAVRITVGRPRPDFISRCLPREGTENAKPFGLVDISVCTADTTSLFFKEGARSFFSGHASLTAASLGFASLYLAGKLHVFNKKGHTTKVWLVFTPLFGSIFVSITRLMDHRHHWEDVTVGMLVGLLFAYIFYRQFYPSLEDPESHIPFHPRIPFEPTTREPPRRQDNRVWKRVPDDEGEQIMLVEPWRPTSDLEAGRQSPHDTAYIGRSS